MEHRTGLSSMDNGSRTMEPENNLMVFEEGLSQVQIQGNLQNNACESTQFDVREVKFIILYYFQL